MAEQAEKNGQEIEALCARLGELERRVAVLEASAAPPARSASGRTEERAPSRTWDGSVGRPVEDVAIRAALEIKAKDKAEAMAGTVGFVPVFGKAVLAVAGAYLLRAVAESGAVPRWMMLVAGIVYAGTWLIWAAKTESRSRFASVVYALTVAAILGPLLWEGTVRFGDFPAALSGAVLVGYAALSLGLEWKSRAGAIPWIAVVVAVGAMAALIVATHELSTLTTAMLAVALLAEIASWSGRWPAIRGVTGAGAVFSVAVIGMVMTADGVPAGYRPMSAGEIVAICVGTVAVFGGSFLVRGFGLRMRWTVPETVVAVMVLVLGTWVSLRATQGVAGRFWGALFLGMAAVCYWGALRRFSGERRVTSDEQGAGTAETEHKWNRRVSANYAAALLLAGSWLLLTESWQVVMLSAAAVAAVMVFTRTGYLSLGLHGTFYLLAAGAVCGMFGYAGRALAGTVPSGPPLSFWVVAAGGLLSYVLGSRAPRKEWNVRVLWVVPAAVVGFAAAAVIVAGIVSLAGRQLSASRLSMVRTVVTCAIALGMACAGSHWRRAELGWVAYGAIALGALKLAAEDLRFGNAGTLMVSLVAYGAILVVLPRVMRERTSRRRNVCGPERLNLRRPERRTEP